MISIFRLFQEHHCYLSFLNLISSKFFKIIHCFSVPYLPLKHERGGETSRRKREKYTADTLFMSCCQMYRINQLHQKQEKNLQSFPVITVLKHQFWHQLKMFHTLIRELGVLLKTFYILVNTEIEIIILQLEITVVQYCSKGTHTKPATAQVLYRVFCQKVRQCIIPCRTYRDFQPFSFLRSMTVLNSYFNRKTCFLNTYS